MLLMPTGSFIYYYTMKDPRPLYTAAARLARLRSAGRGCDAVPFPAKGGTGRSSSVCRRCSLDEGSVVVVAPRSEGARRWG